MQFWFLSGKLNQVLKILYVTVLTTILPFFFQESQSDKSLSIHSIAISPKGSPVKKSVDFLPSRSEAQSLKVGSFEDESGRSIYY